MTNLFTTTRISNDINIICGVNRGRKAALNPKKSLYFEKTMYNRLKSLTLR